MDKHPIPDAPVDAIPAHLTAAVEAAKYLGPYVGPDGDDIPRAAVFAVGVTGLENNGPAETTTTACAIGTTYILTRAIAGAVVKLGPAFARMVIRDIMAAAIEAKCDDSVDPDTN